MSYFSNIGNAVSTLVEGMKVTMGYFVRPREHVTLQYPDEVWPIPSRNIGVGELESYNTIRSKLTVNFEDCIGCKACERACPVACIHIDTFKAGPDEDIGTTSNGTKIKLRVTNFTIDMSECMFCDLCTPPCPEDCIIMTPDYQFVSNDNVKLDVTPEERWRDRDHLIYQFSKVTPEERAQREAQAAKIAEEKAAALAAKASAAEKAAAAKLAAESAAAPESKMSDSTAVSESPQAATPTVEVAPVTEEMEAINVPLGSISTTPPNIESEPIVEKPDTNSSTNIEASNTGESQNG
ncbi:MAG: 4Fe-4S binding protein [Candidatus Marinimicrobia bacterium]|nr:4Fe-4S binding protein [Candidatus Neomarinimicrobiota bacterium]